MKTLFSSTAILAAMTIGSSAQAQGLGGDWYVSVFGGYSNIGSIDTDFYGYDVEHEFDDSYVLGLAVGTTISPGLRAEVELSYSSYEGGDVNYTGPADFTFDTAGDADLTYLMANLWYDIPTTGFGGATPYVGGGIGAVRLDVDTTFGGADYGYGDTVTGTAFQLGAGAQFPVGAGMIDVGYRFKTARGLDIDDNDGSGVYEDGEFTSNNLQVGYVISF